MSPDPERGFILVAALWILLLCGAIGSLLLLRGLDARKQVKSQEIAVQARFDADSALQTVVADLLLGGPSSRWSRLPARSTMDLEGRVISVDITSEDGRIDLNEVDTAYLDRVLQGLKVSRSDRALFIKRLEALRAGNKHLATTADIRSLISGIGFDMPCPANLFTVASGLPQPNETMMSGLLSSALGTVGERGSGEWRPGMAMRIKIQPPGQAPNTSIIRVTGAASTTFETLEKFSFSCS